MFLINRTKGSILVIVLVLALSSIGWAGEKDPFVIDADWISYDSETGDFAAKGNVQAKQQEMSLQADSLQGNMNTKDTHASGNVFWQKGNDNFQVNELFYNYNTQVGFFKEGKGFLEGYYIKTDSAEKDLAKATLEQSWLTQCDAEKVKCYEITAKKMIIYPGEKLIAYDASFWILGKKIFTLKKYTASLKEKDPKDSGMPKIGYSSTKGIYTNYRYNLELDEENGKSSFIAFDYYSKLGTNLRFQTDKDTSKDHWTLVLGKDLDKDNMQLEALPSFTWQRKYQEIPHTSLSYTYGAGVGHFYQEEKQASAWRTNVNVGLINKPISLWDKASLGLSTTYQKNWYDNDNDLGVWSYSAKLNQELGSRGSLGVSYIHREVSGKTPFNFDDPGVENEINTSLNYQLDQYWNIGLSTSYDLDGKKYKDIDYTLTRKLHCFEARFVWREKRDEFNWNIDVASF